MKQTLRLTFSGGLKPIGHCCYDVCGAVVHLESSYENDGKLGIVDIIQEEVKKSKNNAGDSQEVSHRGQVRQGTKIVIVFNSKEIGHF